MKKLITTMLFAVLAIGAAMAQNSKTITGYVVDKNGNPLAGAEVMAAGGGATAITDSDGSFTLDVHVLLKKVTISYPGMGEKTVSVDKASNLVVTMKPQPKHSIFFGLVGAGGYAPQSESDYHNNGTTESYNDTYGSYGGGIMVGMIGKWGCYGKVMYNRLGDDYDGGIVTVGAIKQLGKSSKYLYLGAGVASHDLGYTDLGFSIDFGAIFKINQHLNIITGINYSQSSSDYGPYGYGQWDYYDGYENWYTSTEKFHDININIGISYVF